MTIVGMIIATIILVLSFFTVGPYGIAIFFIVLFGLVFSTHEKNKQILNDLKSIRAKLGLLREDEIIQNEINKSIEEENNASENPEVFSELNKEIEDELEKYMSDKKD